MKTNKLHQVVIVFVSLAMTCTLTLPFEKTNAASADPETRNGPLTMPPSPQHWIDDKHFVYGLELVDFDLNNYLTAYAPHLLPHRELLTHWAGYYSISPKVILTIMDMQSGLVSNSKRMTLQDRPFADITSTEGFENQLKDVLSRLYRDFYAFLMAKKASVDINADYGEINAATYALSKLFAPANTKDASQVIEHSRHLEFVHRYDQLFPESQRNSEKFSAVAIAAVPPSGFLQLPWKVGEPWHFNGVHTWTGSDPGIMSSIDFVENWNLNWGDDTSTDYVVAAHEGIISIFSSCFVRVTAANGWATNYYHLDDLQVSNGDFVNSNQTLGVYANTQSQALCSGGHSTGPHVHFALLNNGIYSSLSDVEANGYLIHPGRFSYDSNSLYMWIEKAGIKYYAYRDSLSDVIATFDIDGNNQVDPLTDGLLIIRYLFGFRGDSLVYNAVASDATRTTPVDIETYVRKITDHLDIDGNSQSDALTDGILLIRYLFGFSGSTLIDDVIADDASRTTPLEIEDYINRYLP